MSNLLWLKALVDRRQEGAPLADHAHTVMGTKNLPLVSKICLSIAGLVLVVSCAAPVDRTRQLLELDLANRQSAIEKLQKDQQADPQPWQAYSLGVLYGAEGDYENMNRWFERCSKATKSMDPDIEFVRLGYWRDEAKAGDEAAAAGDWVLAAKQFENAIQAAPEKSETRQHLIEARVMAFGPGLEEVRTLVSAEQPQALYRWLEKAADPSMGEQRLEVRVGMASQLEGAQPEKGDALASFMVGELCRMDGEWIAMDHHYLQALKLNQDNPRQAEQIQATRNAVSGLLLKESLINWADDQVPAALAKLDTADVVDPGQANIYQARRNITTLDQARTPSQVAETLAVGDLNPRWLTFWMSRLYGRNQLRQAGMVSNELLRYPDSLTASEKSQALRVRVAFSRSTGNLDQTRDDLRELLAMGEPLPVEAVILGDVLLAQSSYEEALHWYDQAQGWGDDTVSLILKKARIAFSQDRFKDMEKLALVASEREPDNSEALIILIRAKVLNGEVEVQK